MEFRRVLCRSFDCRGQQGPDFDHLPLVPYWTGPERRLIELPLSTTFIGHLRSFGRPVYKLAQHFGPVAGALSRFDMLTRVALTPEGIPARDAIAAIDRMLDDGIRVLNLSFHSPSLEPGYTPYVRDAADLRARSEEPTAELQSLKRISYAVFRLKKQKESYKQQH